MSKLVKGLVLTGILVAAVGGTLFGIGIANGKIKEDKIEEKVFTTEESFENIKLDLKTSNLEFVLAEDNKVTITYGEKAYYTHEFSVKDNTLVVKEDENIPWYERIFHFNWKAAKMTIALPKTNYDSLYLDGSTGSLTYSGFDFNNTDEVKEFIKPLFDNTEIGIIQVYNGCFVKKII